MVKKGSFEDYLPNEFENYFTLYCMFMELIF